MSDDLLAQYKYDEGYVRITGTEDWVEVALLGDQGGYSWSDFNVFYSPSARRYFWHGATGCSCNSWRDDLQSKDSFENGDLDGSLRAWENFAKDHSIHVNDYLNGVAEIRTFEVK